MRQLFSIMLKARNFMLILLVVMSFFSVTVAFAQSDIQVFTYAKKTPIVLISLTSSYDVLSEKGKWKYIRFNQPTIPVWLSSDYVQVDDTNNTATVVTNKLNARLNPSLSSPIIGQIDIGYRANIIEFNKGFIQVLAQNTFLFAIDSEQEVMAIRQDTDRKEDSNSNAGWVIAENDDNLQKEIEIQTRQNNPEVDQTSSSEVKDNESFEPQAQVDQQTAVSGLDDEKELDNAEYRLAAGDSISVTVFDESDLNLPSTRIPQSGVISFPLIGPIEVIGKSSHEVETSLISALSQGYVKNPALTVTITSYRPLFIRGAVASAGSFTYSEGLTVAQALLLAGGTKNTAKPFGVSVERNGRVFQQNLSLNSNVSVMSGDVLTVDEEKGFSEEGQLLYVYLHGEVNKPGEYEYRPGLTVEKAVVLAGGFGLRASKRRISVSRYIEGQEIPEIMKKIPLYLPVKPGDIINVGASWF